MKEKEKDEKKERHEIIVLDEGIDMKEIVGLDSVCCWAAVMPVRLR
jgi:hypothetical protein